MAVKLGQKYWSGLKGALAARQSSRVQVVAVIRFSHAREGVMIRLFANSVVTIVGAFLLFNIAIAAGFSYRYFDHDGGIHFGNFIPPEYVVNGYEVLNERGLVVDVILPKKVRDEQTATLLANAEAQRKLEVQRAKDEALLRFYSNPDDVIRVRDRKMMEFDNFVAIQHGAIEANKSKMVKLQRQAADMERSGRIVSEIILQTLTTLEVKNSESEALIEAKLREKEQVTQAFQADIDRLKVLMKYGQ